jgi:hypothetical protein
MIICAVKKQSLASITGERVCGLRIHINNDSDPTSLRLQRFPSIIWRSLLKVIKELGKGLRDLLWKWSAIYYVQLTDCEGSCTYLLALQLQTSKL